MSNSDYDEPEIIINDQKLSKAQAMAVRVAVTSFRMDMTKPNALGADEIGRKLARGYDERLSEVLLIMLGG